MTASKAIAGGPYLRSCFPPYKVLHGVFLIYSHITGIPPVPTHPTGGFSFS